MSALEHCSAYTHVHTDISTLDGVLYVPNSWHITYRITAIHFHTHSWSIVCLWRPTISRFSHVRQLIPLSPRLLDSALVVWIWRRAGAGGTMPCSCPSSAHQAWSWIENSAHGRSIETTRLFQLAGQPRLWPGSAALCLCVYTSAGNAGQ